MTKEDKESLSDVSIIINMMNKEMRNKINPQFIKFVEENKDDEYVSEIDRGKPIEKQNIRYEVKVMLALIYRDYICSEKERKILLNTEEEKIYEMQKAYDSENLFKNKSNKNIEKKENLLIEYNKQNVWNRIILRIKSFLTP